MFHWICPECGREIPPSVRECQACDPNAAVQSAVELAKTKPTEQPRVIELTAEPLVALEPVAVAEQIVETPAPVVAEEVVKVAAEPVEEPLAEAAPVPVTQPDISKPSSTEELVVAEAQSVTPVTEAAAAVESEIPEPTSATEVVALAVTPVIESEIPEATSVPEVVEALPVAPVSEAAPVVESKIPSATQLVEAPVEGPLVTSIAEMAPVESQIPASAEVVEEPVVEAPVSEAASPVELQIPDSAETVEEPIVEALPLIPVAETASPVEPPIPASIETVEEPVTEALRVTPVAETASPVESPIPPSAETVEAPVVEALPVTPVAEALPAPVVETPSLEALTVPAEPQIVETAEPPTLDAPIKLHDVPDPLLALAEEIRAAQAARAVTLALTTPPPSSKGLIELAGAVGTREEVHEPATQAEPVAPSSEPVASTENVHSSEIAIAPVDAAVPVALLAPPELEAEPVGFHELRPAALPTEPQSAAAPEPVALAEPQAQPTALASEPVPEPEVLMLPFAPMQEYTPATSRSILPVPPKQQILAANTGPRITLPGPTLPPELTRLQDANVVTVIGENTAQRAKEAIPPAKNTSDNAPGWLVSVLVMLLLLAVGLGVVFYLLPHTVADAKPAAPTAAVAATAPAPTGGNSPLAKFVEVTGFRIVTSSSESNKKSEVEYLIVNHSDADISDANVFVTLRSGKPGGATLCRFSFKVPSLGPFESKEMSSPIEKAARAISLPDWQDVRAEVQISQ